MPTIPSALRRVLPLTLSAALAACQPGGLPVTQVPPPPVPVDGIGYIVVSAVINPVSRDLFIADTEKLVNAGAREIRVGLNSPGGDIDAAQAIVEFMGREHAAGIAFRMYDVGLVASAATYIFLNAQSRYSIQRGAFLFHAAGLVSNGLINADRLRDAAAKLDSYEHLVVAAMRAHTRLTESEALTYARRTVILNSDDAQRDGIIDSVADFTLPKGASAYAILTVVKKPGTPATPASQPTPFAPQSTPQATPQPTP